MIDREDQDMVSVSLPKNAWGLVVAVLMQPEVLNRANAIGDDAPLVHAALVNQIANQAQVGDVVAESALDLAVSCGCEACKKAADVLREAVSAARQEG